MTASAKFIEHEGGPSSFVFLRSKEIEYNLKQRHVFYRI